MEVKKKVNQSVTVKQIMEENKRLHEALTFGALFAAKRELQSKVKILEEKIKVLLEENKCQQKLVNQYKKMCETTFIGTKSEVSAG